MKCLYTIPGYFEDCIITNDEVKENKLFGKVLFKYKNHELKTTGFFGSTVLVFKNGGIYKPGFFGTLLFKVTKYGEVKEPKIFGKSVGAIPADWVYESVFNEPQIESLSASETQIKNDSDDNSGDHIIFSTSDEWPKNNDLKHYEEELDLKRGWCADVTNVRNGAKTISVPAKYNKFSSIAPFLKRNGLQNVKIHANVNNICPMAIGRVNYIVDENNKWYLSINGILYNKNKTKLLSVPKEVLADGFLIEDTVTEIGEDGFSFSNIVSIVIPNNVKIIRKNAFSFCNKVKTIFIPRTVEIIEKDAFAYCNKLIINSDASEKPVGWDCNFDNCKQVNWNVKQ